MNYYKKLYDEVEEEIDNKKDELFKDEEKLNRVLEELNKGRNLLEEYKKKLEVLESKRVDMIIAKDEKIDTFSEVMLSVVLVVVSILAMLIMYKGHLASWFISYMSENLSILLGVGLVSFGGIAMAIGCMVVIGRVINGIKNHIVEKVVNSKEYNELLRQMNDIERKINLVTVEVRDQEKKFSKLQDRTISLSEEILDIERLKKYLVDLIDNDSEQEIDKEENKRLVRKKKKEVD